MTGKDTNTGMPTIPAGMRWNVRKFPSLTYPLEVVLQKKYLGLFWVRVARSITRATATDIYSSAEDALDKWETEAAEAKKTKADVRKFVGTYPPKKLEGVR